MNFKLWNYMNNVGVKKFYLDEEYVQDPIGFERFHTNKNLRYSNIQTMIEGGVPTIIGINAHFVTQEWKVI
jgi:hypothetical protein